MSRPGPAQCCKQLLCKLLTRMMQSSTGQSRKCVPLNSAIHTLSLPCFSMLNLHLDYCPLGGRNYFQNKRQKKRHSEILYRVLCLLVILLFFEFSLCTFVLSALSSFLSKYYTTVPQMLVSCNLYSLNVVWIPFCLFSKPCLSQAGELTPHPLQF